LYPIQKPWHLTRLME